MSKITEAMEALKGKISFYDNGVDDCIKVVEAMTAIGELIELPCAVGQTVYFIGRCEDVVMDYDDDYFHGTGDISCPFENCCESEECDDDSKQRIFKTTIENLWIEKDKIITGFLAKILNPFIVADIGKTIFFTREEAQAECDRRNKND